MPAKHAWLARCNAAALHPSAGTPGPSWCTAVHEKAAWPNQPNQQQQPQPAHLLHQLLNLAALAPSLLPRPAPCPAILIKRHRWLGPLLLLLLLGRRCRRRRAPCCQLEAQRSIQLFSPQLGRRRVCRSILPGAVVGTGHLLRPLYLLAQHARVPLLLGVLRPLPLGALLALNLLCMGWRDKAGV